MSFSNYFSQRKVFFLTFFLAGFQSSLRASLPVEFLPNLHFSIHENFRKEYSPVHGFNAWESGLIEKMRVHGEFGEDPEKKYYCHLQVKDQKKDRPKNPLMAWIQRLFPSPTLPEVCVNTAATDPISHLSPEIIGMLMEWTLQNYEDLKQDNKAEKTKELFKFIQDQVPGGIKENASENQEIQALKWEKKRCLDYFNCFYIIFEKKEKDDQNDKIKEIFDPWIQKYDQALKKGLHTGSGEEFSAFPTEQALEDAWTIQSIEDLKTFTKSRKKAFEGGLTYIFLQTFVESLVYEKQEKAYQGITIDVLWAFFYKKTKDWRTDFPQILNFAPSLEGNFVSLDYPIQINENNISKNWGEHWRIPFYSKKFYEEKLKDQELPLPFTTQKAWMPSILFQEIGSLNQALERRMPRNFNRHSSDTYSNCGERSLLALLNIIFYDRGNKIINTDFIKEIELKTGTKNYGHLTNSRGIEAFYNYTHNDASQKRSYHYKSIKDQHESPRTHHIFSAMVTTHLNTGIQDKSQHILYLRPYGEIGTHTVGGAIDCGREGLNNMMRVIERLLNIQDLAKFSPQKTDSSLKEWAQKLNGFCYLVSRDHFDLSWTAHGKEPFEKAFIPQPNKILCPQKDLSYYKDILLLFSINQEPSFLWSFQIKHFQLDLFQPEKKQSGSNRQLPKTSQQNFFKPVDLAWYVDPSLEKEFFKAWVQLV